MEWLLPFGLLAFAGALTVLVSVLVWRRRRRSRRKAEGKARLSMPMPRGGLRSQVIVLPTDCVDVTEVDRDSVAPSTSKSKSGSSAHRVLPEWQERAAFDLNAAESVHSAPTREFSAYAEELAALSMTNSPTRELAVHEAPTREFAAVIEEPLLRKRGEPRSPLRTESARVTSPSGFQARLRAARERREEDATLKVGRGDTGGPSSSPIEQLLRMLGPTPTPDLGNIEIYYRLGAAYLAAGKAPQARRCFLTVEGISPGYRDAAEQLEELPIHAPTSSGATPVHHSESAPPQSRLKRR